MVTKAHYFSIDYWRDWKNPHTPAPSADNRLKSMEVQNDWPKYRYRFMVENTLRSTAPIPTLIYVEPHYVDKVNEFMKELPLPSHALVISTGVFQYLNSQGFDSEYLYLTRIDSDDLIHKDAAAEIIIQNPANRTLLYQIGYVYDVPTGRLNYYCHPSPPFYTDIFKKEEVLKGVMPKRLGHGHGLGGLREVLSPGKFVVMCHSDKMQCTTNYDYCLEVAKKYSYLRNGLDLPLPEPSLIEFGKPYSADFHLQFKTKLPFSSTVS